MGLAVKHVTNPDLPAAFSVESANHMEYSSSTTTNSSLASQKDLGVGFKTGVIGLFEDIVDENEAMDDVKVFDGLRVESQVEQPEEERRGGRLMEGTLLFFSSPLSPCTKNIFRSSILKGSGFLSALLIQRDISVDNIGKVIMMNWSSFLCENVLVSKARDTCLWSSWPKWKSTGRWSVYKFENNIHGLFYSSTTN